VHETRGLFACEDSSRRCVPDCTNAVSFFEPPPPPPEPIIPEEFEVPEWYGPPEGVLGGVVPLELLLARSDKAAVVIESATVYPAGMEFVIDVRWRERSEEWLWPGGYRRRRRHGGGCRTTCSALAISLRMARRPPRWGPVSTCQLQSRMGWRSRAWQPDSSRMMRSPRRRWYRAVRCLSSGAPVVVGSAIHNRSGCGRCRLKGR
jgi:hypothetical protein